MSRRAAVAALAVAVVAVLTALSVVYLMYDPEAGTEPAYRVDGYEELRADLGPKCPSIRFFDLSRYEDLPGLLYTVRYDGRGDRKKNWSYGVSSVGNDTEYGLEGSSVGSDATTSLALLELGSYDLRSYDGHYTVAPEVNPTTEVGGVGVEVSSGERVVGEGENPYSVEFYPAGSLHGGYYACFNLGDYYYYISADYGILPGTPADQADAKRDAALQETLDLAASVICQ